MATYQQNMHIIAHLSLKNSNLFHIIVLLFLCQSQIAQKFLAKIVFAVQIDKMY